MTEFGPAADAEVTPADVVAYVQVGDETLGGLLPAPLTFVPEGPQPYVPCLWLFDMQDAEFSTITLGESVTASRATCSRAASAWAADGHARGSVSVPRDASRRTMTQRAGRRRQTVESGLVDAAGTAPDAASANSPSKASLRHHDDPCRASGTGLTTGPSPCSATNW